MYACIYNTEIFDFLIDIIPAEDLKALKRFPAEGMLQVLPSNSSNTKWSTTTTNSSCWLNLLLMIDFILLFAIIIIVDHLLLLIIRYRKQYQY